VKCTDVVLCCEVYDVHTAVLYCVCVCLQELSVALTSQFTAQEQTLSGAQECANATEVVVVVVIIVVVLVLLVVVVVVVVVCGGSGVIGLAVCAVYVFTSSC